MQNRFQITIAKQSYRVYTTLDMNLQRDAVEGGAYRHSGTDAQWKHRSKKYAR